MTNTKTIRFIPGNRVTVWTGETGTVQYATPTYYGIQLDGERGIYEWQRHQVKAA